MPRFRAEHRPFTVMAPTLGRYMDLIVDSTKTPEAVEEGAMDSALTAFSGS